MTISRISRERAAVTVLCVFAAMLASCTSSYRPMLLLSRQADTLTVALDPHTSARWSPNTDSLVVECNACAAGSSRVIEHFDDLNYARYEISRSQEIRLLLYSAGVRDTLVVMGGTGDLATADKSGFKALPPQPRRRVVKRYTEDDDDRVATKKKNTASTENRVSTEKKVDKTEKTDKAEKETEKKTVKKSTSLRVSANEGVAVYTDKSKKQVLKILPQGSTIPLLSREGDMYSVMVGDTEGFVEAEAVQVVQ